MIGKVITGIVMSLDGFVAGQRDDVQQLFKWNFSGNVEVKMPSGFVTSTITDNKGTLVTIAFIARGASTEVILTHDRLVDSVMLTSHQQGWKAMLERLASAV